MATYEILIADDHPLFRSALHQAVTLGLGPDVRLVEVASIAELETRLTEKSDWDLVLLDLNMPGAYGFSGLVLLRGQYPQIPVVMVSAQEEADVVVRSKEFGASGFIPKSSSMEDIQKAVRTVLDGDVSWPPQAFEEINVSDEAKAARDGLASLTPQQFRVLTMVSTRNCWGVRLARPSRAALASSDTLISSNACGGQDTSPSSTVRTDFWISSMELDLGMKPLAPNSLERTTTSASSWAETITTGICGYCPRNSTSPENP